MKTLILELRQLMQIVECSLVSFYIVVYTFLFYLNILFVIIMNFMTARMFFNVSAYEWDGFGHVVQYMF